MSKDFAKAILKSANLFGEEYHTADEHELFVDFKVTFNLEPTVNKLVKLGIPKNKIRMALIIETDEPAYD